MKVKELIEKLKELDQEIKVMVWMNCELESLEDEGIEEIYMLSIPNDSWDFTEFKMATKDQEGTEKAILLE